MSKVDARLKAACYILAAETPLAIRLERRRPGSFVVECDVLV
jgi:hypothetical protein